MAPGPIVPIPTMLTLRAAAPDDIETVADVWHQGWRDGHIGNVPEALLPHRDRDSFRRRVPERLASTTLAVLGGKVVGFVVVSGDELEQLFVGASARGSGAAVALLRHAEGVIARRFERAWLAVSTGNARARRFYEREGWTDAGAFEYAAQIAGGFIGVPCHRYEKPLPSSRLPHPPARRRVLVWLTHAVPAFQPTSQQLAVLVARLPHHEVVSVSSEAEFIAALPLADAAVVWRFSSAWYALAPRLCQLFTPSAGREPFEPDAQGRVALHFGRFHGALMAESLLGMLSFMQLRL
ncbi:MAG TPA: GNAT family N-acetyltransferase, partial [Polyangiaceae bacterium]|nr:GNAT family N-acetyltransferase [Polyangiaceae bacterium]